MSVVFTPQTPAPDLTGAIASTLLKPDLTADLAAANVRIAGLEQDLKQRTWQLEQAQRFERQQNLVVRKIFAEAKGEELPSGYDTDDMYARIVSLVEEDIDDVWEAEREYDVSMTYIVTISGTIKATSKELAREKLGDDPPSVSIDYHGAVEDLLWDDTCDELSVTE